MGFAGGNQLPLEWEPSLLKPHTPLSSLGPHPLPRAPSSYESLQRPEQTATPLSTTPRLPEKSNAREERWSISVHDLRIFQKWEYSQKKRQRQIPSLWAMEAEVSVRERAPPTLWKEPDLPLSTALTNSPPRFVFFQRMSRFSIFTEAAVVESLSRVQRFATPGLNTPGSSVLHYLPEFAQIHAHWVSDTTTLSSAPLSFCLQSFSTSGSSLNELPLRIRWPKYWSLSFSISPSSEYPGLISFRIDWSPGCPRDFKSLLHHKSKASILWCSALFKVQLSHLCMTTGKTMGLALWTATLYEAGWRQDSEHCGQNELLHLDDNFGIHHWELKGDVLYKL